MAGRLHVTFPVIAEQTLVKITPADPVTDGFSARPAAKPLELALQPPPPARDKITTKGEIPGYTYTAPQPTFDSIGFKPPVVLVTALAGRSIQVVRAPAPSMPEMAMTRGISGSCDVLFDVDTLGRPFNLSAQCTDEIFRAEAIRAVSKAEFLPKVSANGIAVEQHGAIYPLEFKVQ